jgi:phosphate:Na+ symporter
MPHQHADLIASLIEEDDFAAGVGETLHQIARRVKRETFSPEARKLVDAILDHVTAALAPVLPGAATATPRTESRNQILLDLRTRCLRLGSAVKPAERGAILALLGSAERASLLIGRLDAERRSVPRVVEVVSAEPGAARAGGALSPMPAE